MGVAQECMHSIKVKKLKVMVLKVDLKAYDTVSWSFLQLVLLQFNLRHEATNWVIGYIYLDNFVVSVNGVQSFFFRIYHGLWQGCSLSPFYQYLKISVVYWLSLENIPNSIRGKIRQRWFNFLWFGAKNQKKFHLAGWEKIGHLKIMGDWGFKEYFLFWERYGWE